ncbi:MAG: SIS domain-containing protein [Acidobacteriaceae bacterium]
MDDTSRTSHRWINGIEPRPDLLTANGIEIFELECREQPECLRRLLKAYKTDPVIKAQLRKMRSLAGGSGPVLLIGMGASFCSAISGAIMLESRGRLAFAVDAGEWLHYAKPIWNEAALSVLITTSGESAELVELFRSGADLPLGLLCNNTASTCWKLARNRLPILAGPEYGNATKTYTNSTAAAIVLASTIVGHPWESEAEQAVEVFSASLDRIFGQRAVIEEFCRGAANIEIIGRGAAYGAAIMSALCIREMSGHRAAAHTGAGFRHGPNLDVDSSHVAIIFAVGRAADLGVKLAEECNRRGGKVVLVSSVNRDPMPSLLPIRIDAVPEPWEGITALLITQALTLAMVERSGCRLPPRFEYGAMQQ